jgi:hypothetical protein
LKTWKEQHGQFKEKAAEENRQAQAQETVETSAPQEEVTSAFAAGASVP